MDRWRRELEFQTLVDKQRSFAKFLSRLPKTRSMTRNQDHDHPSSKMRNKTCDNISMAPWSDPNHDVLYLVMIRLEIVDFVAFSGVCKSWRSFALSNKNKFMASKPPMLMRISTHADKKECCLEDFEGKKFIFILPHSDGRTYIGLTCGYLILYEKKTCDFCLVNPITMHVLHFPPLTNVYISERAVSAILVFSPSISRWVFVILHNFSHEIWVSIAGKGTWNSVTSTHPVYDLQVFKGKIYTINRDCHVYELILYPEPKLMLLQPKIFSKLDFLFLCFVSSGENLYVMKNYIKYSHIVCEVDIGKLKRVPFQQTRDEYAFFLSTNKPDAATAVKPKSWAEADPWSKYKIYDDTHKGGKGRFFNATLWYFPHECLKVNLLN